MQAYSSNLGQELDANLHMPASDRLCGEWLHPSE